MDEMMNVKEIPFTAENWRLIEPPPGYCQECAVKHEPEMPHNAQSLHYQYAFYLKHQRWPNWKDAMAHCTPEMQAQWREHLMEAGVDVDGGQVNPTKLKMMKTLKQQVSMAGQSETISLYDLRCSPGLVFAQVELGKEFKITRRGKVIAEIKPPENFDFAALSVLRKI